MERKKLIWVGMTLGSYLGSYVGSVLSPDGGMFSILSIILSFTFGVAGVYLGFKYGE